MEKPKVPQEIADSFEKLPATTRQKYQFLADYPEYLINQNREELVKAIDSIRKDFQNSTEKIAKELSQTASQTAWKIAIFSLFGGFALGSLNSWLIPTIVQATTPTQAESTNTTKKSATVQQTEQKEQKKLRK